MELRHLRYFVAVAAQQSFIKASRALYVSQSAISEQIADLEREIGVPLLTRGARRTVLTEPGRVFLEHAQQILRDVAGAVREAQRIELGESGTLRVGFFTGGVGENFPRLIRNFRFNYPAVEISLQEMTPMAQWSKLIDGTLDVGFTRTPPIELRQDLQFDVVRFDPIVAILPRTHRLARETSIDIRDLRDERFVISSREVSPSVNDKIDELIASAGFTPHISSVSSVWSSVVLMVQAGEGIALLPLNQQQYAASEELTFVPLQAENAYVEMAVCWSKKRNSALIRSFHAMTREYGSGVMKKSYGATDGAAGRAWGR